MSESDNPEPSSTDAGNPLQPDPAGSDENDSAEPAPAGRQAQNQPQGRGPVLAVVGVVGVVMLALLLLFGLNLGGSDGPDTSEEVLADAAPGLSGVTSAGTTFDIADERGRWVLVNFFATWCPPCVAEHPELVEFAEQNSDDATVVSVAFDEPAAVIEDFFATNGGDWPVVADSAGIPLDWGVVKLPESFLVAPDGTVVEKLEGGVTAAQLEELMATHGSEGESGA